MSLTINIESCDIGLQALSESGAVKFAYNISYCFFFEI